MPSPFPGMDPYLESVFWSNMHTHLTVEIASQLGPQLRPKYLAVIEERFVLEMPDSVAVTTGETIPDVAVVAQRTSMATSTATISTAPLRLANVIPQRVRQLTVEIRDTARRALVAAIEVISPTNKRGTGRKQYLRRRSRILLSSTHLVEIDLLRAGRRIPLQQPLPSTPYFAFVSRVEARPLCDVWPIALDSPLPKIPVPLLPGDADVSIDLQLALTTIYDLVGYDLAVDYSRPPTIPLESEQEFWANELLRRAGLRKAAEKP